jgi:hypothetical protein
MRNWLLLPRRRKVFFLGCVVFVIFLELTTEEEVEVFAVGQGLIIL